MLDVHRFCSWLTMTANGSLTLAVPHIGLNHSNGFTLGATTKRPFVWLNTVNLSLVKSVTAK